MYSGDHAYRRRSGRRQERDSARRRARIRERRHRRLIRTLQAFVALALIVAVVGVAGALYVGHRLFGGLPSVQGLSVYGLSQDTIIFDRYGKLLAVVTPSTGSRMVVPLEQISPYLIDATVATEDHTFYTNPGFDIKSVIRAGLADVLHRAPVQGASTITQQLAKRMFLSPQKTISRKLKELLLAWQLDHTYTKDAILELYLNQVFYGDNSYGVEAASESFFHAHAYQLSLAQASLLGGLPQDPTSLNPIYNLSAAKARQWQVLQAMVKFGYISAAQAQTAFMTKLKIYPAGLTYRYPYWIDYVLNRLQQRFGPGALSRGYRVYTSIDPRLQNLATSVVGSFRSSLYAVNAHDASLVSIDPTTGEIVAMVGGLSYQASQINMALVPRQMGSTMKIFTYSAAIASRRFTMETKICDCPLTLPKGGGVNGQQPLHIYDYDYRYRGELPLRETFMNSLNIPAVRTELALGIPTVLQYDRAMGLKYLSQPTSDYGASLTLGGYAVPLLQLADGAATVADMGIYHPPTAILKVVSPNGSLVYSYNPAAAGVRALSPQVSYIIAQIMSNDQNRALIFGLHSALTLPGRLVGAKTGTSDFFTNDSTVGYTPTLTTAVWAGNLSYSPITWGQDAIFVTAPIWQRFMELALANSRPLWYATPPGVVQVGQDYYLTGTYTPPPPPSPSPSPSPSPAAKGGSAKPTG